MRRSSGAKTDNSPKTFKPITKICAYCERHRRSESSATPRKILRKSWLRSGSSTERDESRLQDLRSDEIIARSLNTRPRRSSSYIKSQVFSPRERKKHVNFIRSSESSDETAVQSRPDRDRIDFLEVSNATSYREPAAPPRRCETLRRGRRDSASATIKESSSDHWSSDFENQHRRVISSEIDSRLRRLLASRQEPPPAPRRLAGGHDPGYRTVKSKPISFKSIINRPTGVASAFNEPPRARGTRGDTIDYDDILDKLSDLSLGSGTTSSARTSSCAPRMRRAEPEPRIVKPRDAMKRAAVKKMLVYPPQGQTGEPLTLFKKWSNIDCHVTGDRDNGLRYTVYYLQKFESRRWLPNPKTGNPFRNLEDSTTDHG